MNQHIEVIEDNAGGITIQHTETRAVAYFEDFRAAADSLRALLDGDDMIGWDLSESAYYITELQYEQHAPSGGYMLLTEDKIREELANL